MGTAAGAAKARSARGLRAQEAWELADDCRPHIAGIDTLNLSSRTELRSTVVEELRALREEAVRIRKATKKGAQTAALPRWRSNALRADFEVQPYGTRKGLCLLEAPDLVLVLNPDGPQNFPRVYCELKAPFLWSGWSGAADMAELLMAEVTAEGAPLETQVSRVDLACDFSGWAPQPELLDHVIGRVVRRNLNFEWGEHEEKAKVENGGKLAPFARTHGYGRRFTGFTFGGGDLLCRLYDKTVEIRRSGKTWFEPLWQQGGWKGVEESGHIWRLEFQIRREPLRNAQVSYEHDAHEAKSWADMKRSLDPVWRYLTTKWLTYRLPRTGKERVRLHPRWRRLMGATFFENPDATLYRHRERMQLQRTTGAFSGYLVRELALHLREAGKSPDPARAREHIDNVVSFALDHYQARHGEALYDSATARWRRNRNWERVFGRFAAA